MSSDSLSIPDDCGYNKIFKYQWFTATNALPMSTIPVIQSFVTGRWGWHFIPKPNMNYNLENWYENQNLVLSFENKEDLITIKLTVVV